MNLSERTIRDRCTEAVFERGQSYRNEGRIQRIERFGDVITATVRGSNLYDVTVEMGASSVDPRCSCPYSGWGDCKHIVAVLLEAAADPPTDERERVEPLLEDISRDDLHTFMVDALARDPDLRDQFLAEFGETSKSVDEYRDDVEQLFDQHTENYPVVVEAIDFSRFFELAERYRERDRYLAAATVYRALFEGIDDNIHLVDAAYDHYAQSFQTALDGYVDCVQAAELDAEKFDSYAGVIDKRASTARADVHREPFMRALDDLADSR